MNPNATLSFIVPAHNEQACLADTLRAIHESARSTGHAYEIVVANDASTDATAGIAAAAGARVVNVQHRQIAATRNSGARAAIGEYLFFVDADTIVTPRVLYAALKALDKGVAGGGAPARFAGPVPLYAPLLLAWLGIFMRLAGISAGAFMFCTRSAFDAVGGFDERLFGAEDAAMSWAIKREGRFVILWSHVRTSGRRTRGASGPRMILALFRMAFFPRTLLRRKSVNKVWYDSIRPTDDAKFADPLFVRFLNAVFLLVMLVLIFGWVWALIPQSWTPEGSLWHTLRITMAIFTCHFGLVLWPCIYFLIRILLRQKRPLEQFKVAALLALCEIGRAHV
jgi:glycosyltransferase involved in cell wall biosynthesis